MTLNDNPRVRAEQRYKILRKRKDRLRSISYRGTPKDVDWGKHSVLYNMSAWQAYEARYKRLMATVDAELKQCVSTLRAFGSNVYYY